MKFLRYLLAYGDFRRTVIVNKADEEQNGPFGQPARNNMRCGAWFRRTA